MYAHNLIVCCSHFASLVNAHHSAMFLILSLPRRTLPFAQTHTHTCTSPLTRCSAMATNSTHTAVSLSLSHSLCVPLRLSRSHCRFLRLVCVVYLILRLDRIHSFSLTTALVASAATKTKRFSIRRYSFGRSSMLFMPNGTRVNQFQFDRHRSCMCASHFTKSNRRNSFGELRARIHAIL